MISDFTYSTNTGGGIVRTFSDIASGGHGGRLTLAGPDWQTTGSDTFTVTGDGGVSLVNTFDGGAPQDGPSFSIGNLWDNDVHDVSSILPSGQTTLSVRHSSGSDCVGVSAAVLEIPQGRRRQESRAAIWKPISATPAAGRTSSWRTGRSGTSTNRSPSGGRRRP